MHFSRIGSILILSLFSVQTGMSQSYFHEEYLNAWQRAADYTLEAAILMPADKYDFKPTAESMSFHAQLIHLVQNLSSLSERITGDRPDLFMKKNPEKLSKKEICAALKEAFRHVGSLIQEMDDQKLSEEIEFAGVKMSKENIFYLMRNHATHHRAQAILYLRMNGIEAPKYRGW